MKPLVILVISLASFIAAVAIPLQLTGNLNRASIERILGKAPSPQPAAAEPAPAETTDPFVAALKQREETLARREEDVRKKEEYLKKAQADLETLQNELTTIQAMLEEKINQEDKAQQARIRDVAVSLSKMKPANAASCLESWPPEEAAAVLRLVKERERGRILDAMATSETPKAAPLLRALREPKL